MAISLPEQVAVDLYKKMLQIRKFEEKLYFLFSTYYRGEVDCLPMKYAYIFGFDGVVANTTPAHFAAYQQSLA